jgi:hypothetical protein
MFGMLIIVSYIVLAVVGLLLFFIVHNALERCYVMYSLRYCRKSGFEPSRWRCGPEFDESGLKTEFSLVELDCLDIHGERRLIRLKVWVFGIRKLLGAEKYPDSHEDSVSTLPL